MFIWGDLPLTDIYTVLVACLVVHFANGLVVLKEQPEGLFRRSHHTVVRGSRGCHVLHITSAKMWLVGRAARCTRITQTIEIMLKRKEDWNKNTVNNKENNTVNNLSPCYNQEFLIASSWSWYILNIGFLKVLNNEYKISIIISRWAQEEMMADRCFPLVGWIWQVQQMQLVII